MADISQDYSAILLHLSMVAFFLQRKLINDRLAKNMLEWTHSGFSLDLSVKIGGTSSKAREALSQYIARPPVSLKKLPVENHAGSVVYHTQYNPYFRTNSKLFPATEFLAELLQHLPERGARLIRRCGLYSSRARGTWSRKPHLLRLAPEGWKEQHEPQSTFHVGETHQDNADQSVSAGTGSGFPELRTASRPSDRGAVRPSCCPACWEAPSSYPALGSYAVAGVPSPRSLPGGLTT